MLGCVKHVGQSHASQDSGKKKPKLRKVFIKVKHPQCMGVQAVGDRTANLEPWCSSQLVFGAVRS